LIAQFAYSAVCLATTKFDGPVAANDHVASVTVHPLAPRTDAVILLIADREFFYSVQTFLPVILRPLLATIERGPKATRVAPTRWS